MVVVSPLNDFGLADLFRIPSLYFDTVNMLGRDLEKLLFMRGVTAISSGFRSR
jgi:hypothetical protein